MRYWSSASLMRRTRRRRATWARRRVISTRLLATWVEPALHEGNERQVTKRSMRTRREDAHGGTKRSGGDVLAPDVAHALQEEG